ncbi:MAG TPA: FG-GAP-like repeat-containing protein [Candidatus Didemnitutus sp.]|nr:FG-GAP-like repeat-containing protein [Candidatus Didemnitutus sp.]
MNSLIRSSLPALALASVTTLFGAAPANDNLSAAIDLGTSASASATGTNVAATTQSGESTLPSDGAGATVWWKWKAPSAGIVTVTTYGIGFDATMKVYSGPASSPTIAGLTAVAMAGTSEGNAGKGFKFTFTAVSGTTYYFQVDGNTAGFTSNADFSGNVQNGTVRFSLYRGTYAPPTITTQYFGIGVAAGQTMTFQSGAQAAGSQTLVYQWYQTDPSGDSTLLLDANSPLASGETISGAATAVIQLGNMPLSVSGNQITLVASNSDGSGSVSANPGSMSVFYTDAHIDTAPTGATTGSTTNINAGQTATFTVVADGGPLPTFQWIKNDNNLAPGGNISIVNTFDANSNLNTSVLSITNASSSDNGTYYVVVKNTTSHQNTLYSPSPDGGVNPAPITLTVTGKANQTAPTISSASSTTFGSSYTATESNSGFGALSWAMGSGANTAGASINSSSGVVIFTSAGSFTIKATFAGDSTHNAATSADFTVTVNKASQSAPVISSGASTTFGAAYTATANTGTGALSWALGSGSTATGAAINSSSGAISYTSVGTIVIKATFAGDANHNSATSANFTVTVNKAAATFALNKTSFTYTGSAQGPTVVPTPSNATFTSGGTVSATNAGSYTATATATGNYSGSNSSLGWSIAKANQAAPVISSAATATVGTPYTATANTGSGALSWALGTGSTAASAGINASTGAVTFTGAGTVVINASFAGDTNHNAATSANFTITVSTATVSTPHPMDFDGDGHNDLVWSNLTTGDRAIWYMNGVTIKSFGYIAGIPTDWRIVGTGDIDGDGHSDLIWENVSTGDRTFWQMNNTTILNFGYLGLVDTAWHIAATGDFNGDGKMDIIWENHTTGDRAIWYLNNGAVSSFGYIAGIDTAWHIVAAADFDGDGKTDLLWENVNTGDRSLWLMDGINILNFVYVAGVDTHWHIVGAVDINGDGKPDLLWENTSTGDRTVWYMNGASLVGMDYIAFVDPAWEIAP